MTKSSKHIIKRDGSISSYNIDLITNAIFNAAEAVGGRDREKAEKLAHKVDNIIFEPDKPLNTPSVEEIQDIVETVLIESGHAQTAKAYILYRNHKARLRKSRAEISVSYKKIWETLSWNHDYSCITLDDLNNHISAGTFTDLIKAGEKQYKNEIEDAAKTLISKRNDVRLAIVAGPSSSGKTTTTILLEKHLKKENINLVALNLDNYFFDLSQHPQDEWGDHDYERPEALDLELINNHITDLLAGKEIHMPRFNFKKGRREDSTTPLSINENDIILIDTLHGMYKKMTASIPNKNKFKIYIESMSQQKDKNMEFIRWTDIRLLRRMIRDSAYRGTPPLKTAEHWHYVRRSELKYIVPYINDADFLINSALPYELPIFKKRIFSEIPEMIKIVKEKPYRQDALLRLQRIYDIMKGLKSWDDESQIPADSLLREFLGGSELKYH